MVKSIFPQQFRLLIWKNSILKIRRPFATLIELLIPIGIIVIMTLVRNLNLKFNMDQCYLREKQMDSMGPIPFVRDFLCTFNTTCYKKDQINWNYIEKYNVEIFINNITGVYKSFPKEKISLNSLIKWYFKNPDEFQTLEDSMFYIINVTTPLFNDFQMILSQNSSLNIEGIKGLSSFLCGFEDNDIHMFIRNFTETFKGRPKRDFDLCRSELRRYLSKIPMANHMYGLISPIIFGNIYYTPHSNFTEQIMIKANNSFVTLDKIRLASIEWREHFKDWLEEELINGSTFDNIRNISVQCSEIPLTAKICTLINETLSSTSITSIIDNISLVFSLVENILSCVNLNKFVPLKSAEDIDKLSEGTLGKVFAGLVLDPSFQYLTADNATFLNYTIRIPTNRVDSTKKYKVLDRFWTPAPRINTGSDFRYYTSGFLMLQEAIDRAFIELVTDNEGPTNLGSSMQIMPSPCYVDDRFIRFAANLMPFLLTIAWAPTYSSLVKSIVYEKEKRLKEFMLVMGLSHLVHWLAWFTITITTTLIPNIITTLILKFTEILEFSNPGVVFLLLFSYIVSFVSQAFMLSSLFSKANSAAVVSGLLYFVFYIPFVVLINVQDDVTSTIYFLTGLLSQVSFCNAVNFIAYLEQAKEGAQFGNLFQSTALNLNFGVGHCIIMLWVDAVIYLVITWYVEAVFPGEFGIPRPWYFFLTKKYWCPKKIFFSKEYLSSDDDALFQGDVMDLEFGFEKLPENLKVGISIQNLTKKYSEKSVCAVDNLNLDFYKSQITAFLGHNGAGKTTTISILTGIFPPTTGTAYISNYDIRKDMNEIRKFIGLCPQHNILFDNLTVEDHIYFYGLLKGMTPGEIRSALTEIVEDVGLTKKRKVPSKNLSGGMKRKLSVAMAFIGNSNVIFLDEPTAGVDAYARRGIWDLLIKYRGPEKTIILTTHHMDEADYLSDRIAIISQGKLKCCGSSIFLKKQFGDGYSLIFVKNQNAQNEDFTDDEKSISGKYVFDFIKKHISGCKFVEETRTQWTVILPLNCVKDNGFSNLFQDLDESLSMLNVSSYGISDTSLEKVFLKVANDPTKVDSTEENDELNSNGFGLSVGEAAASRSTLKEKIDIKGIKMNEYDSVDCNLNYNLLSGVPLIRQQIVAMQIKRFHYTKRNYKGLLSEVILPILMIILIVTLLKMINPFDSEPSMVIHPWLMVPKAREVDLNTFYRKEKDDNYMIDKVTNMFRSDLGESGIRCMNRSVFSLDNLKCYSTSDNKWSAPPKGIIPLESPSCDCEHKGYQICANSSSGGPLASRRSMASSDILRNLTGYNISDFLIKKFTKFSKIQYGGFQFLLPSNLGLSSKFIGDNGFWNGLREFIRESQPNNTNPDAIYFTNYAQEFFQLTGIRTNFTRIWINSKGYVSMPAYANIFDNLLLRSRINSSKDPKNYGIVVSTFPFKYSHNDLVKLISKQMFLEVSLSQFVILALSLIPASFLLFLIEERVSGSKRQQFVSGVNPYVYWVSNFLWDIIKYSISALLVIFIFFAFNYQSYVGNKNVGAFFTILCCYGFAIIPHMYSFSFVFSTPSTAFVAVSAYNMFVGTITTTTTFFLDQLQTNEPSLIPVNDFLKRFFLIFPQYGLGRGMMDISFNYMKFNISNGMIDYKPFAWDITSKKLTSFGILFIFWCIIIYIIESGLIHRVICGKIKNYNLKKNEVVYEEDKDVALERDRVQEEGKEDDVLKVINLTKVYNASLTCTCKTCIKKAGKLIETGKPKLAVNNICFGVKAGECFGLLGVNGAGKTTTFKMLTGEEVITKGDAMINGKSIISDMVEAHKDMGFCPQFDALHSLLTCEEELFFYCRIRGIEPSFIRSTVDLSLKSLSLEPHSKKTTDALSGGNKRKLSTAISLIGNPKLVFMDEPTSGMDAGARRFLWNRIKKITNEQRAVVLTSHNMEECEVLCHRLAIMVDGEFQCLGSVQQLKSKFGDDYFVTLRMNSNCDDVGEREKIKIIMAKEFDKNIFLKDENFVTLQYRIDPSVYKLHVIFDFLENLKTTGLILDYSVSQTTLDDIFINFAKKMDVSKILSATNAKGDSTVRRRSYINQCFDESTIREIYT